MMKPELYVALAAEKLEYLRHTLETETPTWAMAMELRVAMERLGWWSTDCLGEGVYRCVMTREKDGRERRVMGRREDGPMLVYQAAAAALAEPLP